MILCYSCYSASAVPPPVKVDHSTPTRALYQTAFHKLISTWLISRG